MKFAWVAPSFWFCSLRMFFTLFRSVSSFHVPLRFTRQFQTTLGAATAAATKNVLVIVESPTKCATIEKLLNNQEGDTRYTVLSCYGHVRNLQKHTKIPTTKFPYPIHGIDLDNNYAPIYEMEPNKRDVVRTLREAVQKADTVLLANDADREGEAMAWHLQQVLNLQKYQRIRFTEITKSALELAVARADPSMDQNLVAAQETRRVLDRLAGYTVSPILWKKICPGLSAGRVQSVGLSRIVQREMERLRFESTPYYDLLATFDTDESEFAAKLVSINNQTIANAGKDFTSQGCQLVEASKHKLHLQNETQANDYVTNILDGGIWKVVSIDSRRRSVQSPQPYKTSTLQRDAVSKLGFSVDQTMKCAQKLYENGHISYMRTDSSVMSQEAMAALERTITNQFGGDMLASEQSRDNKSGRTKHSQEAHEAIRPALQADGTFRAPEQLSLDGPFLALYRLIYQRTLAYRMPPLVTNQTQVVIEAKKDDLVMEFRASGSVVISPGYTILYENSESSTQKLPNLQQGQLLDLSDLHSVGHETQPPPRFTEATFVKELEDLGVGRPSTYAGTVQILRDRAYVGVGSASPGRNKARAVSGPAISAVRAAGGADVVGGGGRGPMVPSLSAFAVCSFLEKYCPTFVDPAFTARMEERLDEIAAGNPEVTGAQQRVAYLDEFYAGENGLAMKIKQIEDSIDGNEARRIILPALEKTDDHIGLFVGPWGAYIREESESDDEDTKVPSVSLPPALASEIALINSEALRATLEMKRSGGSVLGYHPDDGRPIRLKTGRFGAYLQWGEDDDENASTHSLPREMSRGITATLDGVSGITLEEAIGYCGLPRTVCTLNELPITAAIGPYGPYLKYNNTFVSLGKDHNVLTIPPESAEQLVVENIVNKKKRLGRGVLTSLGEKDGSKVQVKSGRYGTYLNWKKVNAALPDEYKENPESISFEEAWSSIQAKIDSGPLKKGRRATKSKNEITLPPQPKRPKSAYLYFCDEKRPEVAEKAKSLGEISKELAKLWKATSADSRQPYEEMAAAGKEEYASKKAVWEEQVQQLKSAASANVNGAKKLPKRKPASSTLPKRPRSAYLYFCSAKRRKVAEEVKTLGEISKELARQWAETIDRSEYEEAAAADKKRYEEECARIESEQGPPLRRKVNGEVAKPRTAGNTSVKRAPSAYMLFCKEKRPSLVDSLGEKLSFGETTKRLAEMWRESDESTRAKFQTLAEEEKAKLAVSAK